MMRIVETQEGGNSTTGMPLPKQIVEINPNHEIIVGMHRLKDADPALAKVLAEQVYDNCLVAAGLLDDGRSMLPRLNDLMLCVVKSGVEAVGEASADEASKESATKEESEAEPIEEAEVVKEKKEEGKDK